MTLVLGLRCRDGVVLAADSQRSEGAFREEVVKLFVNPAGIVWGTAGTIAVQQEMYGAMRGVVIGSWQETRDAIVAVVNGSRERIAATSDDASSIGVDGLFAWYDPRTRAPHLLRVPWGRPAEFAPRYTAIGAPRGSALFAMSRMEFMEYATLPFEPAKMLALNVADDVIRAASSGVGLPVQMAVVTATQAAVLPEADLRPLQDTVAAFREHQRNFIVRDVEAGPEGDTGIRP